MDSIQRTARRAGFLYVLIGVTAPLFLLYLPGRLIVPGDAVATAQNIGAAELTYRLVILGSLAVDIVFLLLALTLYHLFRDVDRRQAQLMVALVSVAVAVGVVNVLNRMAPLILLSGADFLSVFARPQLEALAMGFLRLHGAGSHVAMVFWGLWLFPFGVLVIRSGFIPRALGVLLIVGCFAYLAVSVTYFVFPAYRIVVNPVMMPFYAAGEVSMMIWLLVWGARVQPGAAREGHLRGAGVPAG